ncbi:MAG TPA: CPBP family intramembrane glutamic endopeptidase [Gemmatimonadales bacterium]|nr:CPBP family intramembrane glutamic endopeptidase [Gemmatimonadales bacterium]
MTAPGVAGRPSPLKAVGWALLYLATGFALMVVLAMVGLRLTGAAAGEPSVPRNLLIQTIAGLLAYGFLTWAIGFKALRLTPEDLRWKVDIGAGRGFGFGFALGVSPAVLALGLSVVLGGASFLRDGGGIGSYLAQVTRTALLLAPAALLEEIMFRGVAQVALARAIGRWAAILVLSVAFAFAHLGNPNGTALGLLNIALAGALLGVVFYTPGGLWAAWGAHLGWNITLAALDAPVSGLPFRIPLIDYSPGGPVWLTGGRFGPEGGLLATVAITLATIAAWRWRGKELA